MTVEKAGECLAVLCTEFSELASDSELQMDILMAFAVMGNAINHPLVGTTTFHSFIQVFRALRAELSRTIWNP